MSVAKEKQAAQVENDKAIFNCDYAGDAAEFPHYWKHTVGSGHAPLALRADWQAQMLRCRKELGFLHARFHDILSDDMGTFLVENDKPKYCFFNTDQIIDFLLSINMKPFVELSFMPSAISSGHKTVFHYGSNVTPPKDYGKWSELIRKLVSHWVERYGINEVRQWFFEVWNEPNLEAFWTGKKEDYFKLYRSTVEAVKSVDKQIKVGGPATAKNEWIPDFLKFCEENNLPVDFVSTHHYPTDAFGKAGDDTVTQLSESKRSVLRDQARIAKQQAGDKPLYYTEWCTSSNPRDPMHDEPYAAAFIVKTVMEAAGLVKGYSYWTFSDIFEENYFPEVPFQGGFGLLNIQGIAKPSYRAYQLLHDIGMQRLEVKGAHKTVDAWIIKGNDATAVILTNFALPRHVIATTDVQIILENIGQVAKASVRRIDDTHANAPARWKQMGKPEDLKVDVLKELHAASELKVEDQPFDYKEKKISMDIVLPPLSVAVVTLEIAS